MAQEIYFGIRLYNIWFDSAAHVILQVQDSAAGVKANLRATCYFMLTKA